MHVPVVLADGVVEVGEAETHQEVLPPELRAQLRPGGPDKGVSCDHGGNKCDNLRQRFEMLGLENLGMVRSLQDRKDINSRNSEQKVMVLLHNLENITVEVMSG